MNWDEIKAMTRQQYEQLPEAEKEEVRNEIDKFMLKRRYELTNSLEELEALTSRLVGQLEAENKRTKRIINVLATLFAVMAGIGMWTCGIALIKGIGYLCR